VTQIAAGVFLEKEVNVPSGTCLQDRRLLVMVFCMGLFACYTVSDLVGGGATPGSYSIRASQTADAKKTVAAGATEPAAPAGNAAECDAVEFVTVAVAGRFVAPDASMCSQDVTLTNTHPDKAVVVIGHQNSSEGTILGILRPLAPQEQSDEMWSFYEQPVLDSPGLASNVDWFVAVYSVPECSWIMTEYVNSDFHSKRIVELPSIGLKTKTADVPACP
jgi:hypothetical protein